MDGISLPRTVEVTCECGVSFWVSPGGSSVCARCAKEQTPTKELPVTVIVSCDQCPNSVEVVGETLEAAEMALTERLAVDGWSRRPDHCPSCTKAMKS